MTFSKLSEVYKACPKEASCDHKKMDLCALAELPPQVSMDVGQPLAMDAAMPLMREKIESPLSPFAFKDELEKALNDYHFGNRFMMYGA